jgi:hypothetical protein
MAVLVVLAQPSRAAAQHPSPGPFVPLGSRLDQLVRWTLVEGGLDALDPLTRPFRLAAVRGVVARQDTIRLRPIARRAFAWLRTELAAVTDSTAVSAELGQAAYRHGGRDSFRPGGASGTGVLGGVWTSVTRGPFVAVVNPAFENRLKDDPTFTGKTDRFIAGRLQTGYVAATGEVGDVVFGRMARNWGPDLFEGLQLSPSAYATDAIEGTLRMGRFALTTIAQRLDDQRIDSISADTPINRYLLAHRLTIRAGRATWIALSETGTYGGPGRGFELAFLSPVNLALLSEYNERRDVNLLWGAELHAPLGRGLTLEAAGLIDDFQVDRDSLRDRRPVSGGLTLVLRAALPSLPVHLSLGYTRVASLTYRNSFAVYEVYAVRGVGIARNASDYDQALLRIETRPAARLLLAFDVSHLRQGAGDFRLSFPSDSVLAQPGQGFLVAPVRRATAARVSAEFEPVAGVRVNGELGTDGGLGGGRRAIASIGVRVRADVLRRHLGSAWPGVEPGANRPWP